MPSIGARVEDAGSAVRLERRLARELIGERNDEQRRKQPDCEQNAPTQLHRKQEREMVDRITAAPHPTAQALWTLPSAFPRCSAGSFRPSTLHPWPLGTHPIACSALRTSS